MGYSVICISRDVGAGGEEIGRDVAEQLGYRYVDEEIIERAANEAGVDPEHVASAEERRGLAARLLDAIAQSAVNMPEAMAWADQAGFEAPLPEGVRELIREAVRQTADEGQAVIVAHAASYVLTGREGVLRVFVTGTPEVCEARLVEAGARDEAGARREVSQGRTARADYLKRFHEVKQELPTHYDLVLNTDQLGLEEAVSAILAVARPVEVRSVKHRSP
jgi:cytidylate kinase